MEMTKEIFKYDIKYWKAWRAKQRAWKMIYGDWEEGYEQLPTMFNAMKEANPDMHYEDIPKPNEWKDVRQIFFRASGAFPSASRPSGTVIQCYPLMVLFCLASTWAHFW